MDLFSQRSGHSSGVNSEGKQGARRSGKGPVSDQGNRNQASIQQQLDSINRSINKNGQDDDHKVFKLNNQAASSDKNQFVSGEKGKNLDQFVIDNPPIKDHGGLLLTEFVIVGDQQTAFDGRFMSQNQVTHILNTCGTLMPNIFDPLDMNNPKTKAKLEETKQANSPLIGRIKYHTIKDWEEHKVHRLLDINYLNTLYYFIEEAVQNFKSCLIASVNNKCASIVVAIVYMMFKYKWNVHKTLEFICSRKTDIEITKTIIKQLQQLEQIIGQDLKRKKTFLRTDWNLHSAFAQVYKEEQLSAKDIFRLAQDPSAKRRVQRDAALRGSSEGFYMGENLMLAEDEASIINFYLNSMKQKKDEKKKGGVQASQASNKGNAFKSMKELIAETLRENDDRKEQLKKLIDWRSLDVVVDKQRRLERERKYLSTFKTQHNVRKKPEVDPVRQKMAQTKRQPGFEGAAKGPKLLEDLKNNEIFLNLQKALKDRMTKIKKPQAVSPEVSAKKERPEPVDVSKRQPGSVGTPRASRRPEADSPVRQSQQLKSGPEELLLVKKETMQARRLSANNKPTDNGGLLRTEDMEQISIMRKDAGPPVRLQTQKGPARILEVKNQHRQQSLKSAHDVQSEERKKEPLKKSAFSQFTIGTQPIENQDRRRQLDARKEGAPPTTQPRSPVTPIKLTNPKEFRSERRQEDSRVFASRPKQPSHSKTAKNIHEADSPMIGQKVVNDEISRRTEPRGPQDRQDPNTTSKKHRPPPRELSEQTLIPKTQPLLQSQQKAPMLTLKPNQIQRPENSGSNPPTGGLQEHRQPSAPRGAKAPALIQTPQREVRGQARNHEDQLATSLRNSHGPSEMVMRAQKSIRHQTEKKVRKINSSEHNVVVNEHRFQKPQPQTEKKASLIERQIKDSSKKSQSRHPPGRNDMPPQARQISDFNITDTEVSKQIKSVQPSPGRPPQLPNKPRPAEPQNNRILRNRGSAEHQPPSNISSPQSLKLGPQQMSGNNPQQHQNHPSQQQLKTKDGRPYMNARQQLQATASGPVESVSIQAQKARYQQQSAQGQKRGNMSHDEQTIYTNNFVSLEPGAQMKIVRKQTRIKSQLDHQTHRIGREAQVDPLASNLALPELKGQPPQTQRSASAQTKRKDPKLETVSQSVQFVGKPPPSGAEEYPNPNNEMLHSTIQPKPAFVDKTPDKRGSNGLTLPTIDMSTHQSTMPNSTINNKRKAAPLETPQAISNPPQAATGRHSVKPQKVQNFQVRSQDIFNKQRQINQSFKLPKPSQGSNDPYEVQAIPVMQKQNSEQPNFQRQNTRNKSAIPQGAASRRHLAKAESKEKHIVPASQPPQQKKQLQAPQIDFIGMDLSKQSKSHANSPAGQSQQLKPQLQKHSNDREPQPQQQSRQQQPVMVEAPRKTRQVDLITGQATEPTRQGRDLKMDQNRNEHTPSRGLDPRKMQQIKQSKNYALQQQQFNQKPKPQVQQPPLLTPQAVPSRKQPPAPSQPSQPERQQSKTCRKPEEKKAVTNSNDMQAALDKIMMKLENQQKAREQEVARAPPKKSNKKTISRAQVISHNKPGDAWIIMNRKVYDVSNFASQHPGGQNEISRCIGTGRDHAADFEEGDHSKRAQNRLKQMYIGDLE